MTDAGICKQNAITTTHTVCNFHNIYSKYLFKTSCKYSAQKGAGCLLIEDADQIMDAEESLIHSNRVSEQDWNYEEISTFHSLGLHTRCDSIHAPSSSVNGGH